VQGCGGSLVIVAPVPGLQKGMPTVLGAYVSPDGSNWTGPYLLPSMSLCSDTSGALAGGPNGTLYCFYADNSNKVRYSVTSDGVDWTDSGTIVGAKSTRTPSVIPWQGGFLVVHPGETQPGLYWNSRPSNSAPGGAIRSGLVLRERRRGSAAAKPPESRRERRGTTEAADGQTRGGARAHGGSTPCRSYAWEPEAALSALKVAKPPARQSHKAATERITASLQRAQTSVR
jgi:hypothetical protein